MPKEESSTAGRSLTPAKAALLLFTSTLTVMAGAIMSPALPDIRRAFDGEPNADLLVRLVLTTPALGVALFGPLAGWLADRVGRRFTLVVGLLLYGAGGTTGLWVDTLYPLLAGRFVLGVGVAAIMTAVTTFIADLTRGPDRGRYLAMQSAFMALGGLFYLPMGGLLAELGWRWPFAIYAISWPIVAAVFAVLPHGAGGAALKQTFQRPPTAALGLYGAAMVSMVAFYLVPVQGPFFLEERLSIGAKEVGFVLGFMTLVSTLSSLSFPRISRTLGARADLALGFGLIAPGFFVLGAARSWATVLAGLGLIGVGFGQVMPNINTWVASLSTEENRGRLMGGLTMSIFLGQFLSPVAAGPLLSSGMSIDSVMDGAAALCMAVSLAVVSTGRTAGAGNDSVRDAA